MREFDPLFYIPFIGPILHGIKHLSEEEDSDDEEEWDPTEDEDLEETEQEKEIWNTIM